LLIERYADESEYWYHWKFVLPTIHLARPYYRSLNCASRLSKNLLKCIREYAEINNSLFFWEVLLITLCIQNNLICDNPEELSTIIYRYDWDKSNVNISDLFHPVKKITDHVEFRSHLATQSQLTIADNNSV
jgi:hypothetical protein